MTTLVEAGQATSPRQPATYAAWRATVEQELKGAPFEKKLVTPTPEGIDVQPLYRREDAATLPNEAMLNQPEGLCGHQRTTERGWRWEARTLPAEPEFSPLPALAVAMAHAQKPVQAAADPLGWLASRGSLPQPLAECFDDLAQGIRETEKAAWPARIVGIAAHLWHEAGATAVQELAFAVATGADYWRQLLTRGLTPAQIAPRTQLDFAVGPDCFMEIAKLRAARLLWSKMAAAFGADPAAQRSFIAARTATADKTLYDKHVNLLRVTTQAFSAVIGGADAIVIRPFDEVAGEATELGERMSRNLHTILAEEFALEKRVDPAGGAWYVEILTDQLARKAWALFQEIEKQGGMTEAVLHGYPQLLAAKSAEQKQALVDTRRRPILGTTVQPNLRESPPHLAAASGVAKSRSVPKPIKSFPALLAAAAKRTTLPTLRIAWTQKRDSGPTVPALRRSRLAEGFEAVRRAGDDCLARHGRRAKVFLARIGPSKQHKPRADFSTGFFSPGGFEIDGKGSYATAEEAADAALASGAAVAVLCSTDETYPQLAPAFARRLKAARPELVVVLAGHPAEHESEYRAAGFDEFIHLRSNVRTTLEHLQRLAGVLP